MILLLTHGLALFGGIAIGVFFRDAIAKGAKSVIGKVKDIANDAEQRF